MALSTCPERGKQISSSAQLCPHCGYQPSRKLLPTKMGDLDKNPVIGGIFLLCGTALLIFASLAFLFSSFFAILFVIPASVLVFQGCIKFFGVRSVRCPYCGKTIRMFNTARVFRCIACNQTSTRDGDYLKPRF